ncbi:MAG: hypothetical protein ACFFDF_22965 [Candidatus Odinarchaeota archaeon]
MKYKNYLGNKKTTLSVSISKSIKNYFERYQRSMLKKTGDKRFKNISVLINGILEICIEFFSIGNGLDDLKTIVKTPKKEISDFFSELLVGVNPYQYEESVEFNKYQPPSKLSLNTYAIYRNFVLGILKIKDFSSEELIQILKLIERFLLKNKLTERFDAYFQNNNIVMEYRGIFSNIHYVYSKGIAGLMGYFGLELDDYYYEDKYTRFDFKLTQLLKNQKFMIKERTALSKHNINKFISTDHILMDQNTHLWIALSQINNSLVSFKDYDSGKKIISKYLSPLENIESKDNLKKRSSFIRKIMRLLSSLNWITITDLENLDFQVNLNEENHPTDYQIMKYILQNYNLF